MLKNKLLLIMVLLPLIGGCGAVSDEARTISISPNSATIMIGSTQQFYATAKNEIDEYVSVYFAWTVSNTSVGTISADGRFYANATGEVQVIAAADDNTAKASVSVISGEIISIEISPSSVSMNTGDEQQFTVYGKNSYSGNIVISPAWEVSGGIGTIEPTTGYFTAEAAGSGTVVANFAGLTDTADITVNSQNFSIELTPEACTYNDSTVPGSSKGDADPCFVGESPSATYYSYIKYDLSQIPSGASIASASLTFYVTVVSTWAVNVEVRYETGSWDESTIGSDFPAASADLITTSTVNSTGNNTITGLGELVSLWVNGPLTNYGLRLGGATTNPSFQFSGRNNPLPSRRPILSITYTY